MSGDGLSSNIAPKQAVNAYYFQNEYRKITFIFKK